MLSGGAGCATLAGTDAPSPIGVSRPVAPAPPAAWTEAFADADGRALEDFREALAPHGAWSEDEALGTVWAPTDVASAEGALPFTPYATSGRWAYDGVEPVWVSELPWGWVTFHYGRWAHAGARWVWVPGRRYAGAWVDWRADPEGRWVGWAATPPTIVWRDGVAVRVHQDAAAAYVYCARGELFEERLASRLVAMPDLLEAASASRVVAAPPLDPFAPRPPLADPGLQRAWMLARPSSASASGVRPRLSAASLRLRTYVAGAPRYVGFPRGFP